MAEMGYKGILYRVAESGIAGRLKEVKQMDWIEFCDVYDYLFITGNYQKLMYENK